MGYRRKRKVYVLKFEDPELAELEVRAGGASVEQLMDLMDLARFGAGGAKFGIEDMKEIKGLFDLFASKLISWNLETEDGTPVTFDPQMIEVASPVQGSPAEEYPTIKRLETDTEAKTRVLRDQDMDLAMDLVMAWVGAVIGVSDPLEQRSTGGAPYPVESIPMETLSASL